MAAADEGTDDEEDDDFEELPLLLFAALACKFLPSCSSAKQDLSSDAWTSSDASDDAGAWWLGLEADAEAVAIRDCVSNAMNSESVLW